MEGVILVRDLDMIFLCERPVKVCEELHLLRCSLEVVGVKQSLNDINQTVKSEL